MGKLSSKFSQTKPNQSEPNQSESKSNQQGKMKEYFYNNKMWCESKYPEMQKTCKLLASEEIKHLACIVVIFMVFKAIFNLIRPPVKKAYYYIKKKVINTFKKSCRIWITYYPYQILTQLLY